MGLVFEVAFSATVQPARCASLATVLAELASLTWKALLRRTDNADRPTHADAHSAGRSLAGDESTAASTARRLG
jgi:hypothetical protein